MEGTLAENESSGVRGGAALPGLWGHRVAPGEAGVSQLVFRDACLPARV